MSRPIIVLWLVATVGSSVLGAVAALGDSASDEIIWSACVALAAISGLGLGAALGRRARGR